MKKRLAVQFTLLLFYLFTLLLPALLAADNADTAKEIQEVSGVKRGLCFVLGCGREGSAGIAAALAANPDLSVHGLALDDA
jgi:hypothetical protein